MSEIDEALKFDPGPVGETPTDADEIAEALKFDPGPVGGTFVPDPEAVDPEVATENMLRQRWLEREAGQEYKYIPGEDPGAGFGTMAEASLVDDPLTRVKIFAEARGIPPEKIGARYRITPDNDIEFKTDSGQWQREISEHPLTQIKSMGASVLSHPSTYLGTAGAVVGGAKGAVAGAMAGEAARKAIGRTVYDEPQTISGNLFDIALEGALALGGEMAGKAITSTINRFKTRKAPRILKRAGAEIHGGQLTPQDHARAEYLKQLSEKHGITLLPHQLYDKASMTDIWIYLRKHPVTANAIQNFDNALENETQQAIEGYIGQMGGYAEEPFAMGSRLRTAAADAISEVEEARKATARPYYEAAREETPIVDIDRLKQELKFNEQKIAAVPARKPDTKTMVSEIQATGSMVPVMRIKNEGESAYIERISKDYRRIVGKDIPTTTPEGGADIEQLRRRNEQIKSVIAGGDPAEDMFPLPTRAPMVDVTDAITEIDRLMAETVPDDPSHKALKKIKNMITDARGSVGKLDRIKRSAIDSVLRKEKADPTLKYELQSVKKALTDAMDIQAPDYAAARGIYGQYGMAQPIEDLKLSVIGVLSQLEKVGDLENAVSKIFGAGKKVPSYEGIIRARRAVMGQDPELWRRAVAHHIREMHGAAQYAQSGEIINHAGKMHQSLFGSRNKQRAMAAAFGGENTREYKTFKGLMQVLQRASRGKTGQSITHFAGEIKERMAPRMGSKMYQFLSSPKQYVIDSTFAWWNDMLMRGRQEELLAALIDPQIQGKIAQIKPLKPGSRRFIESLATMTALVATKIGPQTPTETAQGQTGNQPIPQAAGQ